MNDRELLVLAAKAAGNPCGRSRSLGGLLMANGLYWNPRDDDGDTLRLAVALDMDVHIGSAKVRVKYPDWRETLVGRMCCAGWVEELHYDGRQSKEAATRLAILRAAAEIGSRM